MPTPSEFQNLILNVLAKHKINAVPFTKGVPLKPHILSDLKNHADDKGYSALHHCVFLDNLEAVKFMVESVGVPIETMDSEGHVALEYLQPGSEIYDYLVQKGASIPHDEVSWLPPFLAPFGVHIDFDNNKKVFSISQNDLNKSLVNYCNTKGFSGYFVSEKGGCAGWSFLFQYFCAINREKEYYELLEYISRHKNDYAALKVDKDMPAWFKGLKYPNGKRVYPNGEKLFEGVINDLSWFQHSFVAEGGLSDLSYMDRSKIWEFIKDKKIQLKPIVELSRDLHLPSSDIPGLVKLAACWPNTWIGFDFFNKENPDQGHDVTIFCLPSGKFKYYDSNFPLALPELNSIEQVIGMIEASKTAIGFKDIEIDNFSMYRFFKETEIVPAHYQSAEAKKIKQYQPTLSQNVQITLSEEAESAGYAVFANTVKSINVLQYMKTILYDPSIFKPEKLKKMTSLFQSLDPLTSDLSIKDTNGYNVIHHLMFFSDFQLTEKVTLLALLKEKGLSISISSVMGTAMHYAIRDKDASLEERIQAIKSLKLLGVNIEEPDSLQQSLLSWAMASDLKMKDKMKLMHELVLLGANLNTFDSTGSTPLHDVVDRPMALKDKVSLIRFLKEHGADENAKREPFRSALEYAFSTKNADVIAALKEPVAKKTQNVKPLESRPQAVGAYSQKERNLGKRPLPPIPKKSDKPRLT